MTQLTAEKCVACRADSPHVTDDEVRELLPLVPDWELITDNGVRKLRRTYKLRDFAAALELTNRIGAMAEEEGHHPMLVTEWGRLTAVWWTHKIKDLHRNDFIMAAKSDLAYSAVVSRG